MHDLIGVNMFHIYVGRDIANLVTNVIGDYYVEVERYVQLYFTGLHLHVLDMLRTKKKGGTLKILEKKNQEIRQMW